jgi:hypothetical protein
MKQHLLVAGSQCHNKFHNLTRAYYVSNLSELKLNNYRLTLFFFFIRKLKDLGKEDQINRVQLVKSFIKNLDRNFGKKPGTYQPFICLFYE